MLCWWSSHLGFSFSSCRSGMKTLSHTQCFQGEVSGGRISYRCPHGSRQVVRACPEHAVKHPKAFIFCYPLPFPQHFFILSYTLTMAPHANIHWGYVCYHTLRRLWLSLCTFCSCHASFEPRDTSHWK